MKILLLGKNGQIGWELQRSLAPLGEVIALGRHDAPCGDFMQPSNLAEGIKSISPDVIVNAAAYTRVDDAESDSRTAMLVNASAVRTIAQAAAQIGAWLVHYSTDYVFDGRGSHYWRETDQPNPLNEYGRSKFAGEEGIKASGCNHLVFRTSWVYGQRGTNFAKTMLALAKSRDYMQVVDDQAGAPTRADFVADVTAHVLRIAMADPQLSGTYHLAASGETTWYGYAKYLIARARAAGMSLKACESDIEPVSSCRFPLPAKRPANSRLDTTKLRETFGLHMPDWKTGIDRLIAELIDA